MPGVAMSIVEIPEKALPDLKRLVELDGMLFEQLLTAISESGPTLTSAKFYSQIAAKAPNVEEATISSIIRAAFSLYSGMQKAKASLTPEELADGVANSSLIAKHTELSPDFKRTLSSRLGRLLKFNKVIAVTSKAFDVMTEHDKIFCDARILSDIRPVFADNPDTADAAVIIHNLQIGFHQQGTHHEVYVALDTDDILKLKEIVERAEIKTKALEAILKRADLPYLER
jgi:hypothetical protein